MESEIHLLYLHRVVLIVLKCEKGLRGEKKKGKMKAKNERKLMYQSTSGGHCHVPSSNTTTDNDVLTITNIKHQ